MPYLYNKGQRRIGYALGNGEVAECAPGDIVEVTKDERAKLVRLFPLELVDAKGETATEAEKVGVESPDESLESLTKAQLVEHGAENGLELDSRASKADLIQAIEDHLTEGDNGE